MSKKNRMNPDRDLVSVFLLTVIIVLCVLHVYFSTGVEESKSHSCLRMCHPVNNATTTNFTCIDFVPDVDNVTCIPSSEPYNLIIRNRWLRPNPMYMIIIGCVIGIIIHFRKEIDST